MEMCTYLTIEDNDIYLDGMSTHSYNGLPLWNYSAAISYFRLAKKFFEMEFGIIIKQFHILQAENAEGIPRANSIGNYCWLRIMTMTDELSGWILTDCYPSNSYCSSNCLADCGNYIRANSAFRKGLVLSLMEHNPKINILKITKEK